MRICQVVLKGVKQFNDFELDLTYPNGHQKAGQPLEKICLIGNNGTGKSTLLEYIHTILFNINSRKSIELLIIKYLFEDKFYYVVHTSRQSNVFHYDGNIDIEFPDWKKNVKEGRIEMLYSTFSEYYITSTQFFNLISLKNNSKDLLVFCPSEGSQNLYRGINDVPQAQVSSALQLFENFSYNHVVNSDTVNEFWKVLLYLIKKRENDLRIFENQERNLDRTVRNIREEFNQINPRILEEIATLWNRILYKANLEFDFENANNPAQLTDNLKAYIVHKNKRSVIHYSQLSTGIRNFIFKVGHIYSLYFNRDVERGFLLIDEPENSLFPDFLYDIVDVYYSITKNTQLFMATHSPIIAAQFEPYERIILNFDDEGNVHSTKGTSPIGDDPNDLLIKDFGIRSLMGKEGIEKWERYIELKVLIKNETNEEKKKTLIYEFMEIGNKYNFSGDEVFKKIC